jgi:hypothetical protein
MSGIEFRLCFSVFWKNEWIQFQCEGKEGLGVVKDMGEQGAIRETVCAEGLYYRAFAWAFTWNGGYTWVSKNQVSKRWLCEGDSAEPVVEGIEFLIG